MRKLIVPAIVLAAVSVAAPSFAQSYSRPAPPHHGAQVWIEHAERLQRLDLAHARPDAQASPLARQGLQQVGDALLFAVEAHDHAGSRAAVGDVEHMGGQSSHRSSEARPARRAGTASPCHKNVGSRRGGLTRFDAWQWLRTLLYISLCFNN